jgi:predicted ester cyclase
MTTTLSTPEEAQNIAVVRHFIDGAINGGDAGVIDETWAPDMTWHGGSMGDLHGLDAYKAFFDASASGAWKDMHLEIHDVIAQDEKVVVRFTNSGTNVGDFMGNPPTGRDAAWLGIGIYTVHAGRITSGWFAEDILHMLLQLGTVTLPSA